MTLFPTQPNIPSPTTAARPVAVPAPGVSAPLGADDAKRARILADAIRARAIALPSLLLPVPLGANRLAERGFNQAQEIARLLPLAASQEELGELE